MYFSKPAFKHIEEFISKAVHSAYHGKVTQIVTVSHALCHRTTYGKFLSNCINEPGRYEQFGNGLRTVRKSTQREKVAMIYKATKKDIPIEDIFYKLKIA